MDSPLLAKSKQFALDIIKVCNKVKSEKRESVLTNQLIRSGTSIGANIREAFYGHGKNDFRAVCRRRAGYSKRDLWICLYL